MRQTKTSDPGPHDEAIRLASRRFAIAVQAQLALAQVQILDSKRALHDAGLELERARRLGIGVERPQPTAAAGE